MKAANFKKLTSSLILASCIFLVNCDSTSRREIKARVSDKARQNAAQYPPCNVKVNEAHDDRLSILIDINKLLSESKLHELDAAQKNELLKLVIDLKTISNSLIKEIQSIKQSGSAVQPQGCNRVDPSAPGKKIAVSITNIQTENLKIEKDVAAVAKQKKSIIDDDNKDDDQDSADDNVNDEDNNKDKDIVEDKVLQLNSKYKATRDFADAMDVGNKDGNMYILEGKIHVGENTKKELTDLMLKSEKTFCYLEMSSEKLVADELISVKVLTYKVVENKNITNSQIIFANQGDVLYSLRCSTATNDKDLAAQNIRSNLKELLILNP